MSTQTQFTHTNKQAHRRTRVLVLTNNELLESRLLLKTMAFIELSAFMKVDERF